jgi:hypothetical protein
MAAPAARAKGAAAKPSKPSLAKRKPASDDQDWDEF